MASQISSKSSDRKKYDFRSGLQRDLLKTRAALRQCVRSKQFGFCSSCTTFGQLFEHTEGQIANLNRVLQNLKRVEEIDFDPELFLVGVNDDQTIQLKQRFWKEEYIVDSETWNKTTEQPMKIQHLLDKDAAILMRIWQR
jgi:hypothetical protein